MLKPVCKEKKNQGNLFSQKKIYKFVTATIVKTPD